MGNICSSCSNCFGHRKNVSVIDTLRTDSNLHFAQQIKVTPTGHKVIKTQRKRWISRKEINILLKDPEVPKDFKLLLCPPYNSCDRVVPYLYLTSLGGVTEDNIISLRIKMLINATYEWPTYESDSIVCIRVPVDDGEDENISVYFDDVSEKLDECCEKNCNALVHCMAGASRSVTLVLAHLVKSMNISLKEAFDLLKQKRELIRPNMGFWGQLIEYERRIRGKPSVHMVRINIKGFDLTVPDFYEKEYPLLYRKEIDKQIDFKKSRIADPSVRSRAEKQFNPVSMAYE